MVSLGSGRGKSVELLWKTKPYENSNKARPRPVRVKAIHDQHQINLINMKNMEVVYKGKTYKYILSFLDVFSQFHWLYPLESKHSSGSSV